MHEDPSKNSIVGTLSRFGGTETLISSGIPSLDELLGDGIPVGSLVIIEEDSQGLYARIVLKYFLAEGVVNKHRIFVASQEISSEKLIHQLPQLIESKPKNVEEPNVERPKMKIAFRYDNLPTEQKEPEQKFGHYYDLSSVMSQNYLDDCKITTWDDTKTLKSNSFYNQKYYELLTSIKNDLKSHNENNILRIGIHALGSPVWHLLDEINEEKALKDLTLFLYSFRMMIQTKKAVGYVTIPAHLFEKVDRLLHLSDIYIRLQAFAGTEFADNKYLSDFQGFIHIDKLTPKNGFNSKISSTIEHVFKLRRKKFTIEMLHLPPDLDATEVSGLGCATGSSKLDF
ncbi:elongator complex protein 4 [Onthophagus taurus]|uniref:elongator complex protein 4 n=1 Tax=Onthophagus taurus TaxID=166361 RepID=UPI0039BDC4B3